MTDERARTILDGVEHIKATIIEPEVARLVAEHLKPAQKLFYDIQTEANKAHNHLTALIVAYERGSLPKKDTSK